MCMFCRCGEWRRGGPVSPVSLCSFPSQISPADCASRRRCQGFCRKSPFWLVVWNIFPYIGNNHPNWLILFRGVAQPATSFVFRQEDWHVEPAFHPSSIVGCEQWSLDALAAVAFGFSRSEMCCSLARRKDLGWMSRWLLRMCLFIYVLNDNDQWYVLSAQVLQSTPC